MTFGPRFIDAVGFATELHSEQMRKGTQTPYVAHLLGTAATVLEHGGGEDEVIAALLHDAVEDQGGLETRQRIVKRFGKRVAEIVDGCTDSHVQPKPPWQARKEAFVKSLADATPSVLLVTCSDKLYNARTILRDYRELGEPLWKRFNAGRQTLWYYRSLMNAFRQRRPTGQLKLLIDELDFVVSELERLAGAA